MGEKTKFLLYILVFLLTINIAIASNHQTFKPELKSPTGLIDTTTPTLKWYANYPDLDMYYLSIYEGNNKIYNAQINGAWNTNAEKAISSGVLQKGREYKWEVYSRRSPLCIPFVWCPPKEYSATSSATFRIKKDCNLDYICSLPNKCVNNILYSCTYNYDYWGCREVKTLGSCQTCTNNPLCTKGTGTYCDGKEGWVTCESKNGCLTMTDGQSCAYGCNNGKCNPPPTIVCSSDSQCGSKTSIGTSCSGNSVIETFNIPKCANAGTSSSYCTSQSSTSTIKTCSSSETCSGSQCVSKPKCYQDSECGSPTFQEKKCSGNTVISVFKKPTCVSAGTPQAVCDNFIEERETLFCSSNELCSSGACIAKPNCYQDSDCGTSTSEGKKCEGNSIIDLLKIPKCINAGQSSAYCSTEDNKLTVQNCEDQNTKTSINYYCKGNDVRATQSWTKHECLEGFVGKPFCGKTDNSADWLVKACSSNEICENNQCKPKPTICGNGNCEQGETKTNCIIDCQIEKKVVVVYSEGDRESANLLESSIKNKRKVVLYSIKPEDDLSLVNQFINDDIISLGGVFVNPLANVLSQEDKALFSFRGDEVVIVDNSKEQPKFLKSPDFGFYQLTTNSENNKIIFIAGIGAEGTKKATQEFINKDLSKIYESGTVEAFNIIAYPKLELLFDFKEGEKVLGVINVGSDIEEAKTYEVLKSNTYIPYNGKSIPVSKINFADGPVTVLSLKVNPHAFSDYFYGAGTYLINRFFEIFTIDVFQPFPDNRVVNAVRTTPSQIYPGTLPSIQPKGANLKAIDYDAKTGLTKFYSGMPLKNMDTFFVSFNEDADISQLNVEFKDKCTGSFYETDDLGNRNPDMTTITSTAHYYIHLAQPQYLCKGNYYTDTINIDPQGIQRDAFDAVFLLADISDIYVGKGAAGTVVKTPIKKSIKDQILGQLLKQFGKIKKFFSPKYRFLLKIETHLDEYYPETYQIFTRMKKRMPNVMDEVAEDLMRGIKPVRTAYEERGMRNLVRETILQEKKFKEGADILLEPDLFPNIKVKKGEFVFGKNNIIEGVAQLRVTDKSIVLIDTSTKKLTSAGEQVVGSVENLRAFKTLKNKKYASTVLVEYTTLNGVKDIEEFEKYYKILKTQKSHLPDVKIVPKQWSVSDEVLTNTHLDTFWNQIETSSKNFITQQSTTPGSEDLYIENLDMYLKDASVLYFDIVNNGGTNDVEWKVKYSDKEITGKTNIGINSRKNVKVELKNIESGVYIFNILLDHNNLVSETNEDNNKETKSFYIITDKNKSSCSTNACSSVDRPGIYCGIREPGVFNIMPDLVTCEIDANGCLIVKNSKACRKCETPNSCLIQTTTQQDCTKDEDCGSSKYEDDLFCQNGNIFDYLIKPICKNNKCEKKEIRKLVKECTNGCSGKECTDKKCVDTDGTDIFTKGTVNIQEDYCIKYENNNRIKVNECNNCFLIENICENDQAKTQTFTCDNGCKEGKCLTQNNIPTIKTIPIPKTLTIKANEKTTFDTDLTQSSYVHEWYVDDKLFSKTKTFTFEPSTQYLGSHNIKLKIKINNYVFEDDWNLKIENNLEEKPDLEVKEITITNKEGIKSDQQALIKITIKNNGLIDVPEAELLFENKVSQKTSLKAGEEKIIFTTMGFGSSGNFNVQAIIDPQNLVDEFNENNNQYMTSVIVR